MLKLTILTILLILCLALATSAPTTNSPVPDFAKFKPCADALDKKTVQCTAGLPEGLKNLKDIKEMANHPEWCCLAHKAFQCIDVGFKKEPTCAKFIPFLQKSFDSLLKTLIKSFEGAKCDLTKCH